MLRFLGALVVVAAIAVGVALYFNWITFSVDKHDGNTDVKIGVHGDRFREDVTSLQQKAQNIKPLEVKGKLGAVEVDKRLVTVQSDGGAMDLRVTDATVIRVGDKDGRLADLRPGMRVAASYVVEGEQKTARSIRVEAP
jgi:hypothetical protein